MRIAKRNGEIIHFETKDKFGSNMHIYFKANPLKEPLLMKLIEKKSPEEIDLNNYGEVLASCYGMFPNPEVKKFMKDNYNYEA